MINLQEEIKKLMDYFTKDIENMQGYVKDAIKIKESCKQSIVLEPKKYIEYTTQYAQMDKVIAYLKNRQQEAKQHIEFFRVVFKNPKVMKNVQEVLKEFE